MINFNKYLISIRDSTVHRDRTFGSFVVGESKALALIQQRAHMTSIRGKQAEDTQNFPAGLGQVGELPETK